MNSQIPKTVGIVVAFMVFVGLLVFIAAAYGSGAYSPPSPTPASKPYTKTRCDFTGVMASSIIADESANGYQFDGRVSTLLCGEGGLSFHLKETL